MISSVLTLLLLVTPLAAQVIDCDSLVCNPCAGGTGDMDIVFLLDASGSMDNNIQAVRNGLADFVAGLAAKDIVARMQIVLYGGRAEVISDWETDGNVVAETFRAIRANTLIDGFHNKHQGVEAGFEVLRQLVGEAPDSVLRRQWITETGDVQGVSWRGAALKTVVIVTDENADCPWNEPNWKEVTAGTIYTCGSNWRSASNGRMHPAGDFDENTEGGMWWKDRELGWQAMVKHKVYLTMLISVGDSPSAIQYCDSNRQVQNSDFTNFDAQSTLNRYIASGNTENLQAKMLANGLNARCFRIEDVNKPEFIANFFQTIIDSTTACESAATCFNSTCDPVNGCVDRPLCDPELEGCQNCLIGGSCYAFNDLNPTNACEECDRTTGDSWRPCDDGDICTEEICDPMSGCTHVPICTPACNKCQIGNLCADASQLRSVYEPDAQDGNCYWCDPAADPNDWTLIKFDPTCCGLIPDSNGANGGNGGNGGSNPSSCVTATCEYGDINCVDYDGDGVNNLLDNCISIENPLQQDEDEDGLGDACDQCPLDASNADICAYNQETLAVCSGNGACVCGDGVNPTRCVCDDGWFGTQCQTQLTCKDDCNGRGTCVLDGAGSVCVCDDFYDGSACERDSICNPSCQNSGACIKDLVCSCRPGWAGADCSVPEPVNCAVFDCGLGECVGGVCECGASQVNTLSGCRYPNMLECGQGAGNGQPCPDGEVCSSEGFCGFPCTIPTDCAAGLGCTNGICNECVVDLTTGIASPACPSGQQCTDSSQCVDFVGPPPPPDSIQDANDFVDDADSGAATLSAFAALFLAL